MPAEFHPAVANWFDRTFDAPTPAQREAVQAANEDIVQTRAQLRTVQFELNRDISRLKSELIVFNIVLVPAVLALLAIVMGLARSHRRARARQDESATAHGPLQAGARA